MPHSLDAHGAGANTPKNDGAGSACDAPAPEKFDQQTGLNFASDIGHGKALATLKAQAALCGCRLVELADGSFLICKWNYSRAVPCLRAVGDVLRQIGGRHG